MYIRPLQNYYWAGQEKIDSKKVYKAEPATNEPRYKERGLVFVEGYLLTKLEYEVVDMDSVYEKDMEKG